MFLKVITLPDPNDTSWGKKTNPGGLWIDGQETEAEDHEPFPLTKVLQHGNRMHPRWLCPSCDVLRDI